MLKMNLQLFSEEDDNLFSEEDVIMPEDNETDQPQSEESESVEETTPTEEEQKEINKIKIKYNKEEKELTLDEARELAQKGMNYDKLQEKLKQYENDPRLSFVEKQAKKHNMSTEEYLQAVEQAERQEQIKQLAEKENVSEEVAERLLKLETKDKQREEEQRIKSQQHMMEQQKEKEIKDFYESFPNVKSEDFKEETINKIQEGMPLKQAYLEQEFEKQQQELKILKQNNENYQKAKVGATSNHGNTEMSNNDDFLKGFDSI